MDRDEKINKVIEDMKAWQKRDPTSFWEHVFGLEQDYLASKTDEELQGIYEESI